MWFLNPQNESARFVLRAASASENHPLLGHRFLGIGMGAHVDRAAVEAVNTAIDPAINCGDLFGDSNLLLRTSMCALR